MSKKSSMPDLKEVGKMAGKFLTDVKDSVKEIVHDYKTKRTEEEAQNPTSENPASQETKSDNPGPATTETSEAQEPQEAKEPEQKPEESETPSAPPSSQESESEETKKDNPE